MAQTLAEIKAQITTPFMSNPTVIGLYGLTPGNTFEQEFSVFSIVNILFNSVAFAIFTLQKLMDIFRAEVEEIIAASRPHTKGWYRDKGLSFLYGIPLIPDTDKYDLTGYSEEDIATAKIITNAAAVKTIISGAGAIRMKAATTIADELAPLDPVNQLPAFSEYMNLVTDAGTTVICTSGPADDLKLKLDIYYDPLVLAADGSRLDGTSPTPVPDAIKQYLKGIKFNGQLILTFLEQELKNVGGVKIPVIKGAWSKHSLYNYTDAADGVGPIDEIRTADAGYMKLDEAELEINYISFTE